MNVQNLADGTDALDVPNGVEVYEVNGPLFFGASYKFRETIMVTGKNPKILIIRMRHVPVVDATGLHNLKETIRQVREMKTKVILSGVQHNVYEELRKAGIVALLGKANVLPHIREALRRAGEVMAEK